MSFAFQGHNKKRKVWKIESLVEKNVETCYNMQDLSTDEE